MIGLAGLFAMGGRTPQILQAESARFRQPTADLVFGEAPGWHQVSGQRIAGYGGVGPPLRQGAGLWPRGQKEPHFSLAYFGGHVVGTDRGREEEESPFPHLGPSTRRVAA